MKFWILTLTFVAFAEANLFAVEEDNVTCLLLQLNGSVTLTASIAAKEPITLSFEEATLINKTSNCTLIKLNLTKSVEVWFEFNEVNEEWSVIPFAQLNETALFNITSNETITYSAAPLEDTFNKTQSYQCNANSTLNFTSTEKHNVSVVATVDNFKIQSVNASRFVPGKSCREDLPTTVAPTSTAAPITTPDPSRMQNFSCSNGTTNSTTTKFRLIGTFSLSITYNATVAGKNQSKTVTVEVPKVPASETDCSSESNESLTFKFFGNWSIQYIFQSESDKKYYISNITVTYVHDEHLPNSTNQGHSAIVHFSKPHYLEASTSGYYTCRVKTSQEINEVTLHTENFKYKAFNDKDDIKFSSGEVTECQSDDQTSSVVPIAVGAALAGLVVIVLIAYLIGRRRSRKAGYESV